MADPAAASANGSPDTGDAGDTSSDGDTADGWRGWFHLLVILSLLVVAWRLHQADRLRWPRFVSWGALAGSLGLVCAGFLAQAASWTAVLRRYGCPATLAEGVASSGLAVFGKYLPGKVWAVVGRASYMAIRRQRPVGPLAAISLIDQLLQIWVGLALGACALFLLGGLAAWGWLVLGGWLGLTLILATPGVQGLAERGLGLVLRRRPSLPWPSAGASLALAPWFLLTWLLWAGGFYLLAASLGATWPPAGLALTFPLATTLGILAVLVPGGLGVREGILAAAGSMVLPVPEAATLAVTARAWFLAGEGFLFLAGCGVDRARPRAAHTAPPSS